MIKTYSWIENKTIYLRASNARLKKVPAYLDVGKGNASLRTLLSKRPSASMSSVIFSPAVSSGNKTPDPLCWSLI